ncbi:MAG: ABC transporter ATP-binding protein [Pirellulaceae bacterium]|jgi:lipoprotein-releasing system ATP-binding protein|nr:ABC transporter ATP-binding protein [Pirellulaceae bacterium]
MSKFLQLAAQQRRRAAAQHAPRAIAQDAAAGVRVDQPHSIQHEVEEEVLDDHILLSCSGVKKTYKKGKHVVPVLRGVDLDVPAEQFTAIIGQSGSGKSTLLHLLATLDRPDAGEIYLEDRRIDTLGSKGKELLRNSYYGMIFQFYHLLPELTALENVLIPKMISDTAMNYFWNRRKYMERAKHLMHQVGLSHRLRHKPNQLSGGEMQRTAIARALISNPRILLADEPMGNLDEETGAGILDILRSLNEQHHLTIVMVTHDQEVARTADQTVVLTQGRVERV